MIKNNKDITNTNKDITNTNKDITNINKDITNTNNTNKTNINTNKNTNKNKNTNNIFNKGYNHTEWINLCDGIINFLLVFGAIINLIIFALVGFSFSCFTSFITLMLIGSCKLAISIIKFFRY